VPDLDDARVPCLGVYTVLEHGGVVALGDAVRVVHG